MQVNVLGEAPIRPGLLSDLRAMPAPTELGCGFQYWL